MASENLLPSHWPCGPQAIYEYRYSIPTSTSKWDDKPLFRSFKSNRKWSILRFSAAPWLSNSSIGLDGISVCGGLFCISHFVEGKTHQSPQGAHCDARFEVMAHDATVVAYHARA